MIVDQTLALFGGMQLYVYTYVLQICDFVLLSTSQQIGIDIFFGRWDTHEHPLTDVGKPALGPDGQPIDYVCYAYIIKYGSA